MGKKNKKMIEAAAGNQTVNTYIGVLDGLRSIAVIIIIWYHFWEHSWLTPYINFNNQWTRYLGITESHLHTYLRYAFVFTDLLILISAICNFWPYARSIVLGEAWPDTKTFFINIYYIKDNITVCIGHTVLQFCWLCCFAFGRFCRAG